MYSQATPYTNDRLPRLLVLQCVAQVIDSASLSQKGDVVSLSITGSGLDEGDVSLDNESIVCGTGTMRTATSIECTQLALDYERLYTRHRVQVRVGASEPLEVDGLMPSYCRVDESAPVDAALCLTPSTWTSVSKAMDFAVKGEFTVAFWLKRVRDDSQRQQATQCKQIDDDIAVNDNSKPCKANAHCWAL